MAKDLRQHRTIPAGAVLKPSGGNCAVLPKIIKRPRVLLWEHARPFGFAGIG